MNSIVVHGARENNLKNIDVEIPANQMTVIAGVSGSGKSSLAFQVIYGEGQRRLMDAFSNGVKRFATYVKRPEVDSITGLSPVIAVRQKVAARNPRSTVGTMTEILDYIRVLYANEGICRCPYCNHTFEMKTAGQITEFLARLKEDTIIEITAPITKLYTEEYDEIVARFYQLGYKKLRIHGVSRSISDKPSFAPNQEYQIEVVIDQYAIGKHRDKQITRTVQHALEVGNGMLRVYIIEGDSKQLEGLGCNEHHVVMGDCTQNSFVFNNPESACPTCSGLGESLETDEQLLIYDESLSIKEGALVKEAFQYDKNSFKSMLLESVAKYYRFTMDMPFSEIPKEMQHIIFYGSQGEKIPLVPIEDATKQSAYAQRIMDKSDLYPYEGMIPTIERSYQEYKKKGMATLEADKHFKSLMRECECIDCKGSKLKKSRLLVQFDHMDIDEVCNLSVHELISFFGKQDCSQQKAKKQLLDEIVKRLKLLEEAGLSYIHLNRKSDTLSGGELQRVKLASNIGSGLQGITYVLDEPSIGLHPKDNSNLIQLMKKLRDSGNTVIVVEHDMETIRNADHIIEMGPGSGTHGGQVITQGSYEDICHSKTSMLGKYFRGELKLETPISRRKPTGQVLQVNGARENNLKNITVHIPLGLFVSVTGVSGSGKSTLIYEVLYKKLYSMLVDPKTRFGKHDSITGVENINRVIYIDQTPIGKNCRSIPATYLGFYDDIRKLFAREEESKERGYTASRFSFNQKGGRCEECQGEGIITTNMNFMPSVESVCRVCHGARYNRETLEIQYRGKDIAEILDLSVAEAMEFFKGEKAIYEKLAVMSDLGLDYLKIGQSSTTLSGGEAQRIKIAYELSMSSIGSGNLYLLDEPTTGLHIADIAKLLKSLNQIVDMGNTVIVIEHNMEFVKATDYVIDLGPDGGSAGGEVLACGTPEDVMKNERSYTGRYLKEIR